ncbi:hypothetical protein LXL04_023233 [Taraxacum kok-saghyz]
MWILLMMMMNVVTLGGNKRVRKEPLPKPVEGSGIEEDPKLSTLRKRKRAVTSVDKTGGTTSRQTPRSNSTTQAGDEEIVPNTTANSSPTATKGSGSREDTQPTSSLLVVEGNVSNTMHSMPSQRQRRKRGPNINKKATQVLDNLKEIHSAARLTLTRDIYTMKFVGDSATYFATEVGIVIRKYCPLEFHTWEKVPNENKEDMMDRLRVKFQIPHEDKALVKCVEMHLQRQWKRTRSTLKAYWVKNGGIADPSLAKSKMDPNCRSKEDWEHMCKYWETDKAQKYADQMKQNREKLVVPSRGGSRSIANHKYAMENIVKMKEDECAKLVSAGTTITPVMEYKIEKNAVTTVCSKPKTLLSGWESSSGPVMRKKDIPYFSASESSQSTSKNDEEWKSKYDALEEEQRINKEELRIYQDKFKRSEEKSEKLSQFLISKFPDAQDMLFPNHDVDEEEYDLSL